MKLKIFIIALITAFPLLFLSCTTSFDERNTDPTKLTSLASEDVKGLFTNAEYMAMYSGDDAAEYQYAQGFFADLYAQYSAITATFDPTDRYNIAQDWVQHQWIGTYVLALPPIMSIIKETDKPETIAMNSIARIWKVWTIHRATDYYGPIPYSQIGSDDTTVPYDPQRDIYFDLFEELDQATTDLANNLGQTSFGDSDVIFGGDNVKWLKFGNSLRLRLALRISNVEPAKAQEEAEAAVDGGVMSELEDDAYLEVGGVNYNGFNRQSGWNEFRMSSAMESILVGYEDPRLEKFWQPAEGTGEFEGVRNGMNTAEITSEENLPENNSGPSVALLPENMYSTPSTVMYTAETYFNLAEGALNNWDMGGTAEEFYEKGIELSMNTWGITDAAVITDYINSTNQPIAPDDYFDTPALSDIPVAFSTDPETQREQINTQKWIALFPEGHEAWANMRRSGYPKRYPLVHSDNPDVPADEIIRRIPFLNYDRDRNGSAVSEAESLLDGPDHAGTRLWWDVLE